MCFRSFPAWYSATLAASAASAACAEGSGASPRARAFAASAVDPASGDYRPESEVKLPDLGYIDAVADLHHQGRYREALHTFIEADGDEAALARKVIAGYIAYAFERVGEVTDTLDGIDRIMGMGFNWAPPGVLVDVMGAEAAVRLIDGAGLAVPEALAKAASSGDPAQFFNDPRISKGRFFVAG